MIIRQRKDQIMEIAFVLFIIVTVALTAVIAAFVYNKISVQLHGDTTGMVSAEALSAYDKFNVAWNLIDKSIVFIVIGLTIGLIITSFLIPTHPVFVVVNIIGFIILVFIAAVYSNTYYAVTDMDQEIKNVTLNNYSMTSNMMWALPWIAAGLVFICSVVMYGKGRQEGFG